MANNQIVKASRKSATPFNANRLGDIEHTLDKLWTMFQTQVERNAELMLFIQNQQGNPQLINEPQTAIESVAATKQLPAIAAANMPELGFEKLKRMERVMIQVVTNLRVDAMYSMLNVFHYLNQFGGEAYPEQLISLSGTSSATFYRYLKRMRECRVIKIKRGKIVITELGSKIYNEEINTETDLRKAKDKQQYGEECPQEDYDNIIKREQSWGL